MGDFSYPDICWESNSARHMQSKWFLQCIEDNFLMQVVEEPMRQGGLLDVFLTNRHGFVRDVKVGGSLGCRDHEMVEFKWNLVEEVRQKAGLLPWIFGEPNSTSSGTFLGVCHGLDC